jgi:hypothetical protein
MKHNLVLVALIHRNNYKELLLVKRKREPEINKWSLPGGVGALEKEKDPFKAIKIEIHSDFLVDYDCNNFYNLKSIEEKEPTLYLYFEGKTKGEPKLRKDSKTDKEIKWFKVDDIIKMKIGFENRDKPVIKKFKKDYSGKQKTF